MLLTSELQVDASDEACQRSWKALFIALLIAFSLLASVCTLTHRYLFADGAGFFLGLLTNQKVSDFFPTRYYTHVVTQLPTVVLLHDLGLRNATLAGLIYGANLFFLPMIGLSVTWWAAQRAPVHYLFFPFLSHAILTLTSSLMISNDSYPAVSVFWCLLYMLKFSDRLNLVRTALILTMAILSTRMYESFLFLAWPLVYVSWQRGRAAQRSRNRFEICICAISGLLFVVSAGVALYSTAFPFHAGNRGDFLRATGVHLAYGPVLFSLLILYGILWQIFLTRRPPGRFFWRLVVASGIVVAIAPVLGLHQPWTYQYASRVQSIYVPLLLGSLVAVNPPALAGCRVTSENQQSHLRKLLALTCLVTLVFQGAATWRWMNYRQDIVVALSKQRGEFYSEPLDLPKEFEWGWAMPPLSVTLCAIDLGSIPTIIPNPELNGWAIFDAQKPAEFPDLSHYGISNDLSTRKSNAPLKHNIRILNVRQRRMTYTESMGGVPGRQ
ncbi:MAG: hypothetical protein U0941_26870 [Planctomycetaceae bacterium]